MLFIESFSDIWNDVMVYKFKYMKSDLNLALWKNLNLNVHI